MSLPVDPPPVDEGGGEISRQLESLALRLAEGVGVPHADILVRQAGSGSLKVVAHHGGGEIGPAGARVHEYGLGETGARSGAIDGRIVTCSRDDDPGLAADERAEMAARGERAVMYVPIIAHDEVVGLLAAIETRLSRQFTAAEEAFAQQLAWEAAVAVDSARVVEQLSVQNREMSLLLQTGAAIAGSVDLRETLSTIARLLVETLGAAWSNIYDYHPGSAELEVIAFHQIPGIRDDPEWLGRRFGSDEWAEGLDCAATRATRTVYYDWSKLTPEEFAYMEPWGEKALMIVPIVYGDEVLGLLDVAESRYPRRFTPEEIRLAEAIANQSAMAVRNARLYDEATRLYAEARDRNTELETVLGAAEALGSTVDFNLLLKAICWRVKEVLGSVSVEVYEYVKGPNQLIYLDHAADEEYWVEDPDWSGAYEVSGNAAIERCVDRLETVIVTVDGDDIPDVTRAEMIEYGTTVEMWIPMVYKDEVVGVLSISEVSPDRRFDDAEVRLAAAIAGQAAAAMANARAYLDVEHERARLQRVNRRLRAFTELSGGVRGLVGESELLEMTGRVMSEALGFAQWVTYLHDPLAEEYVVRAAVGAHDSGLDEQARNTPIPARIIAGLVDESTPISQSFFVDHRRHAWTEEEHRYLPGYVEGERGEDEWHSDDTLFVPMAGQGGTLIGYLEAYDPIDRQLPDEETVRLLEIFAARAASAVELSRAHAELELQSRTDGLTGLFNHRYFQERVQDEVARAVRTERPLTVLMIDVDNFKEFNDTYGHPQGDRLLKALAGLLAEQTRQRIDFIARYGGEEFVVLLPDTGLGGAQSTAARLRGGFEEEVAAGAADDRDGDGQAAADAGDETAAADGKSAAADGKSAVPDGESAAADGESDGAGDRTAEQVAEAIRCAAEERAMASIADDEDVRVTISIGMAVFPEHGVTADALIANADKALYVAKQQGKNRTCLYGVEV